MVAINPGGNTRINPLMQGIQARQARLPISRADRPAVVHTAAHYGQAVPKTDFSERVELISQEMWDSSRRLGSQNKRELASMLSRGDLTRNNIIVGMLNMTEAGVPQIRPEELAEVIHSDHMKLSDAGEILSSPLVGTKAVERTLVSLYLMDPDRMTELLLRPQMSKLKLAYTLYDAKNGSEDSTSGREPGTNFNFVQIMRDVLGKRMSGISSSLLLTHIEKEDFPELFSASMEDKSGALPWPQERLRLFINAYKEAGQAQAQRREALLTETAQMINNMPPDEAAEVLKDPAILHVSGEILGTHGVPAERAARIIASKELSEDAASAILSRINTSRLAEMLSQHDRNNGYVIGNHRLVSFFKSRYLMLAKATELFSEPVFEERAKNFAVGRSVSDVLLNTLLYYLPVTTALRYINENGRSVSGLRDVLSQMFHPELDEPPVP